MKITFSLDKRVDMAKRTILLLVCFVALSDSIEIPGVSGYLLPTTLQFLSSFLNISEEDVIKISNIFNYTVNPDDVTILYYNEQENYEVYSLDDEIDLQQSLEEEKTVIITHGWTSSGKSQWIKNMASIYQEERIRNTLAVDWQTIAGQNYLTAASATKEVGILIGDWVIGKLLKNDTSLLKNIHLIGHSLGAHVSGFIGDRIHNVTGEFVGRISGLDAAGPLFEIPVKVSSENRLDASDATYVDVYHTCVGYLGFASALGDQDFYVNYGGPIQTGCVNINFIDAFSCSHERVHEVFSKSINSEEYLAQKCNDASASFLGQCKGNIEVIAGDNNNNTSIEGNFYFNTDADGNALY